MARRPDDVRMMRNIAKRLRAVSLGLPERMAARVLAIAAEFEKYADMLERRRDRED